MDIFEGPGKVQLIVVAHLGRDLSDGQTGLLEQLGSTGHPVVEQVGLGALAHCIPEHLAEIAAVEAADRRDFLHRDIPLVVLLDEGQGLLDVKVPDPPLAAVTPPRGALDQAVQKQKAVGDQVDRAGVGVVDDVQHLLLDLPAGLGVAGGVDRLAAAEPCQVQALVGPQSVKFQPGVFPGVLRVGPVGGDLPRHNQKAVVRRDLVLGAVGQQHPPPRNGIVEQVVIAGIRAVGMGRTGPFPAELIQVQVNEAFVPKYMKFQFFDLVCLLIHDGHLLRLIIYQNASRFQQISQLS